MRLGILIFNCILYFIIYKLIGIELTILVSIISIMSSIESHFSKRK